MIEHIPPIEAAFEEMFRVLRPGAHALYVYPAEPVRGAYSWPASIILYGTPFRARDIHVHKLTPTKGRAISEAAGFEHLHSEFHFRFTPQYATVLRRRPRCGRGGDMTVAVRRSKASDVFPGLLDSWCVESDIPPALCESERRAGASSGSSR